MLINQDTLQPWFELSVDIFILCFSDRDYIAVLDHYLHFPVVCYRESRIRALHNAHHICICQADNHRRGLSNELWFKEQDFQPFSRADGRRFHHVTSSHRYPVLKGLLKNGIKILEISLKSYQF